MSPEDLNETRTKWNTAAEEWRIQVGTEGDRNRILNSDPVLWRFVGDVTEKAVLDAGCGTGYLTKKLHDAGASVVGVDFAEEMIAIARQDYPGLSFRVDSCSVLQTVPDESKDLLVSNYVLMDTPHLEETVQAFFRVLKPGGVAVLVFSHPCFPGGFAEMDEAGETVQYTWHFPYFTRHKNIDPPWAHFTSEFIWFHRPLSDYWKTFKGAGFIIDDFEEPRILPERYHLAESARKLKKSQYCPYSVAFRLVKAI